MRITIGHKLLSGSCVLVCAVLLSAKGLPAQSAPATVGSNCASGEPCGDVMAQMLNRLNALTVQLARVSGAEERDRAEIENLKEQLRRSEGTATQRERTVEGTGAFLPAGYARPKTPASATVANDSDTPDQNFGDRLARLEEDAQLTAANVREQSQTKVESGSKYRLRLSGIVLLNMFETRGVVDNLDIPQVALPPGPTDSGAGFGGTLRQSQIGIETFGPDMVGAHTSANVTLDFAGGLVDEQNGATKALVRLRTGSVRLDWANTSVVAGQDSLFFVPLTPSSLSTLAVPALAYAGDLWSWTPQVRVEHRTHLANGQMLLLQGGILDQLTGDVSPPGFERHSSWGEKSGQPAYAGRIAWSHPAFGDSFTLGAGGYYGHQYWALQRHIDGWAATLDLNLPLGKYFEFSDAFYRGRGVGGLGGGIGQTVIASGPLSNPASIVEGLDSMGGWAQLKFKPTVKLEINAALGDDNPFTGELRRFPGGTGYFGAMISRNLSPFVNFIYQARPDILFSTEYRRIDTSLLTGQQKANLVDLSVGYTF